MRIVVSASVLVLIALICVFPVAAQDSPASTTPSAVPSSAVPANSVPPAESSNVPSSGAPGATVAQSPAPPPPAAATLNEVLDKVVQREHFFMAQMRHMHPMVETYLQDLKGDHEGNVVPVKDQYFLKQLR